MGEVNAAAEHEYSERLHSHHKTEDDEPLLNPEPKNQISRWRNHVHEPILFLYVFSFSSATYVTVNLFMERACLINLNHSWEDCKAMTNSSHSDLHNQAQIIGNNYILFQILISTLPASVLSIFVGPWSDKYGFKPPIYLSVLGTCMCYSGMLFYTKLPNAPLDYALLSFVPMGLTGGRVTMLGCMYAMASVQSKRGSRTIKYALLEFFTFMAVPAGILTSGFVYEYYGYAPVYEIAIGCQLIILLLVLFVVKEDTTQRPTSAKKKIMELFSLEGFKENLKTSLKKRQNKGRKQIWCLFFSMAVIILNYFSLTGLLFVYCNKVYGWDLTFFSEVSTISSSISTILMVLAVPVLTKVWKISDPCLGIIGVMSILSQTVVRAFAKQPWLYYLALALGLLGSIAPMALRSRLSKMVEKDELGKIFSLVATIESLVPLVGTIVFTEVYNMSVMFFPGLVFAVAGVTLTFPLGVLLWILCLPSMAVTETRQVEDRDESRGNHQDTIST